MNVIPFSRETKYVVYFFTEGGQNVVRKWFYDEGINDVVWAAFESLLDIYESGGIPSIRASIIPLENGFFALKVSTPEGGLPCPIFRSGPFNEEMEITFLAGARWDQRKNRVRPFGAVGDAEENLETLLENPDRRRRG